MHRSFSSRRYLISTLLAAGAAATVPACGNPVLPPDIDTQIVVAQKAPPPISGGTLLVTSKGVAVAADPDRDVIWVVDLKDPNPKKITLQADDEPGRVIEDAAGRVHVALRRSGAIVTIDPATLAIVDRTQACPAPRGMAYDATSDVVHVACAGGELVTLPAAGGAAVQNVRVTDHGAEVKDLRDIVVSGDQLLISRFRLASVLVVNKDGTVITGRQPPGFDSATDTSGGEFGAGSFSATGAWRMVPLKGGGVVVSHQRSLTTPVVISQPDGYGGRDDGTGCSGGIVHPAITAFDANGNPRVSNGSPIIPQATLPVDMAVSDDGDTIAVVAAGSNKVITSSLSNIEAGASLNSGGCLSVTEPLSVGGATAAAYWGDTLVVQSREPASIAIFSKSGRQNLVFKAESVNDTGHYIFHHQASDTSNIACASCHFEGHDDGHVWQFEALGARRTQTLGGDIFQTLPFHWDGDMQDLGMIMSEVFQHRMGGDPKLAGPRHASVLQGWMAQIPRLPVSASLAAPTAIDDGRTLFNDPKVGCATCHSGAMFTNNTNQDVGTGSPGQKFQVPSLVGLSNRAPYLHDGSAATIRDRFTMPGASTRHGNTADLTAQQIDDLVAYLETL